MPAASASLRSVFARVGGAAMAFKSRAAGPLLGSGVWRRFALSFSLPVAAGAVLTVRMHQAGWHKEAEGELERLVEEFPTKKEGVAGLRETIKKVMADLFVEDTDRAYKTCQHQEAQDDGDVGQDEDGLDDLVGMAAERAEQLRDALGREGGPAVVC